MDKMAKDEQAQGLGESLEQIERRFKHWRQTRRRGEHIPAPLWAAAVNLGRVYGPQDAPEGRQQVVDLPGYLIGARAGTRMNDECWGPLSS